MAIQENDKRPHLLLSNTSEPKSFTAHSKSRTKRLVLPDLPRAEHGLSLRAQLSELSLQTAGIREAQENLELEGGLGIQIQFVSQPDVELAIQSLSDERKGIELLSVVRQGNQSIANVFVPDGKLSHFEGYIQDYLAEKKNKNDSPIDHKNLLNTIQRIRVAELKALWTDDPELLPDDLTVRFAWEVWLPARGRHGEYRDSIVRDFNKLATASGCEVFEERADFPERVVVWMYGSQEQLSLSVRTLNCVAELRKSKVTADFFDGMAVEEQQDWIPHLLERTVFPDDNEHTPRVCLVDSGVNRGHPLLEQLLSTNDMHTVNPAWGVEDVANHGTGLAGIALYGDLTEALDSDMQVSMTHRLESVKLLDNEGGNVGTATFHAHLFAEAVTRPEVTAPFNPRVFNSSITSDDYRDRGKPSSWSAMLDNLASDAANNGDNPRLFVQSAGNMLNQNAWMTHPHHLSTNLIHDPGQAWNVITVGAYTNKVHITEHDAEGYEPLAPYGGLSPMTSTSSTWNSSWPMKPDVVFEGGNAGKDAISAVTFSSLSLLTTHNNHLERLFTTTNATSAASAQCSSMAAKLMASYPSLRPETIRALIVHSAEWTTAMRDEYLGQNAAPNKTDYVRLIRHCGWGIPNLDRALWSASNSLTLVVEDTLQPYNKVGSDIKSKDMNLHSIPWPVEELEALGDIEVEMKVTLSYFIEPNPSNRGSISKYYYPSHRLRFDCRRPTETLDEFIHRISAAREEDEGDEPIQPAHATDAQWLVGETNRHRGSLHQDIWKGTAAQLAQRGYIVVYPALGWWRSRSKLEKYESLARYSLIVSIKTPPVDTDLYVAIQNRIQAITAVPV
ncbi:MAG: S8 family peptidase [Methylotenera sp.]|nr:S8 family peptidase [Methylotenera sp.]